jgi:hypothetical protein
MRDVHRIARWALLLAVALVPLLMASPALAGTFVYVGNADSNEIYVLRGRPALPQTGRQHVAHYLWWPQRDSIPFVLLNFAELSEPPSSDGPHEGSPIHYRITSSARPSSDGGIVRPRALAVLRLMTSSNFVGCSMGRSPGLAPLRILST